MKKGISLQSIVVVSPDQVSADLGAEAAILQMKTGIYYGLDVVGSRIWELLKTPRRVAQIRDLLVREYDVTQEVCEKDLTLLLEDLLKEHLVTITDKGS